MKSKGRVFLRCVCICESESVCATTHLLFVNLEEKVGGESVFPSLAFVRGDQNLNIKRKPHGMSKKWKEALHHAAPSMHEETWQYVTRSLSGSFLGQDFGLQGQYLGPLGLD